MSETIICPECDSISIIEHQVARDIVECRCEDCGHEWTVDPTEMEQSE